MNTSKRKTIVILGATGMLGSAIYGELKGRYHLVLAVRNRDKIKLLDERFGGTDEHKVVEFDASLLYKDFETKNGYQSPCFRDFLNEVGSIDYIVNAVGVTIPFARENPALTFFINSALPHILAEAFGPKLIHITTDCVYNGVEGFPYNERSPKTPVDIYGLSKSLGEPQDCLVLRTSIIGRELEGFMGLLEWFLRQKGKTITGFANHFWNGITTNQFAKICDQIMTEPDRFPRSGIFHIFSTTVSKYEMLLKFKERFKVDCEIKPDYENKLNRTLTTIYDLNKKLEIPSFDDMLQEL
jgi:dTDP-4-dehydrorhamnose reductase